MVVCAVVCVYVCREREGWVGEVGLVWRKAASEPSSNDRREKCS